MDELNDTFHRVSPTKSSVPMEDFNANIGTSTDTWKGVIGRHGITEMHENCHHLILDPVLSPSTELTGFRMVIVFTTPRHFDLSHVSGA